MLQVLYRNCSHKTLLEIMVLMVCEKRQELKLPYSEEDKQALQTNKILKAVLSKDVSHIELYIGMAVNN